LFSLNVIVLRSVGLYSAALQFELTLETA